MDTDPQTDQDPDDQPAPTDPQAQPATVEDGGSSDADPAPGDEAEAGSASNTDEPAASDAYGYSEAMVGDFTTPDVDLSHLVPTDDGDPDDEEPAETVDQDATGQAVVTDRPGDDDPEEPTA